MPCAPPGLSRTALPIRETTAPDLPGPRARCGSSAPLPIGRTPAPPQAPPALSLFCSAPALGPRPHALAVRASRRCRRFARPAVCTGTGGMAYSQAGSDLRSTPAELRPETCACGFVASPPAPRAAGAADTHGDIHGRPAALRSPGAASPPAGDQPRRARAPRGASAMRETLRVMCELCGVAFGSHHRSQPGARHLDIQYRLAAAAVAAGVCMCTSNAPALSPAPTPAQRARKTPNRLPRTDSCQRLAPRPRAGLVPHSTAPFCTVQYLRPPRVIRLSSPASRTVQYCTSARWPALYFQLLLRPPVVARSLEHRHRRLCSHMYSTRLAALLRSLVLAAFGGAMPDGRGARSIPPLPTSGVFSDSSPR